MAFASFVAVAAFPLVAWFPAVLTPGKFILADPSNDTPPIVMAFASFVAVAAFPVHELELPVTFPIISADKVPFVYPVPPLFTVAVGFA